MAVVFCSVPVRNRTVHQWFEPFSNQWLLVITPQEHKTKQALSSYKAVLLSQFLPIFKVPHTYILFSTTLDTEPLTKSGRLCNGWVRSEA